MGTVIYSATAFEVFLGDFVLAIICIIVMPVFGLIALMNGIFGREEKIYRRILWASFGLVILLIMPQVWKLLADQWAAMKAEPRTTTALVERLDTVDEDEYPTGYALVATVDQEAIVFFVPEPAFEQVTVGGCYTFTYHTLDFTPYDALASLKNQYVGKSIASHVTRILVADVSACR